MYHMERFNLKKINEVEGREKYQVQIPIKFTTLENLDGDVKISAKESLGYYEFKQHKPWFDKECLELLDQRAQTRL
jgi:hypothetical protein